MEKTQVGCWVAVFASIRVVYTCVWTALWGCVCMRLSIYSWQGGEKFLLLDSHLAMSHRSEKGISSVFYFLSLFPAFPVIIVLCSKRDNRLTVSSVPHEIQPSLILGISKILAWNFAVAGARGKCVLHTDRQPVPASAQTVLLCTIAGGPWEAGCKLVAGSRLLFLASRLFIEKKNNSAP